MPTHDSEWDEERRDGDSIPAEADDVNALSLTIDRPASHLGISSIKAALSVMFHIQPQLQISLASLQSSRPQKDSTSLISHAQNEPLQKNQPVLWTWKGQILVDAYFKRVHIFTPMLNEVAFRADYLKGERRDAPWLALLNTVFAMGSIVATKSSDLSHFRFYNKALEHLNIDALGSSHIETVQALALLGGCYLHYINRPNLANSILGATIRMASALGLHRETVAQDGDGLIVAEMRRRTWWSLFCLDTWTTTTMGRPSFGRTSPAITLQPPKLSTEQVSVLHGLVISASPF